MNSERKFIHDISSPLGVTYGMIETVVDALKASGKATAEDITRLEKALSSLNKVTALIQNRREELGSSISA